MNREFVDLREADNDIIENIIAQPERYYVFIRVLATHIFPEDVNIPKQLSPSGSYIEFLPPKILYVLTLKQIAGLLFVDELSNVQREDQLAMFYSLILEKEFGWAGKLSSGVKIIAAANDQEWSEIVRPLPKPLRNRLTILYVAPPTPEEWIQYMIEKYGDEWEKLTGTYLRVFQEDLLQPPEDDWENFPTPRSWTQLATLLKRYENTSEEFKEALIYGSIGHKIGVKFATIYKQKKNIEKLLNDVLANPELFNEVKIEDKVLIISHLASLHIDELKEKAERLITWMAANAREWLVTLFSLYEPKKRMEALRKLPSTRAILDIIKSW
ncbi:MAG: hypothetical protein QW196_03720 [Sulfolobales archaeon]